MKRIFLITALVSAFSCATNRDLLQNKYNKNEKVDSAFLEQSFPTSIEILKNDGPFKESPINLAASYGDFETFSILYNKIPNISNKDKIKLLDNAVSIYRFGDNCLADCYLKRKENKLKIVNLLLKSNVKFIDEKDSSNSILNSAIRSAFAEVIPLIITQTDKINKNEKVSAADLAADCYFPEEDMVYSDLADHVVNIYDGKIKILKLIQSYGLKYKENRICKIKGFEPPSLLEKKNKFIEIARSNQSLILK